MPKYTFNINISGQIDWISVIIGQTCLILRSIPCVARQGCLILISYAF